MVLYVSPEARGGVDVWMKNIHAAMRQAGVASRLTLLPHRYNFAPFLLPLALRGEWAGDARVVHSGTRAGFALRAPGRPLVVTVHHLVADPTYHRYTKPAQRLFHRLEHLYDGRSIAEADVVTCVSQYTRQRVGEIYGRTDAHVVPNGIDTGLFRPDPAKHPPSNRPFRLLFVGNRTRRKGADLLGPIMSRLGDGYELRYTGGQRRDEVHIEAANVVPLGQLSLQELADAYNSSHALIFPSRLEGFGLAVAEAMACGLPVIASRSASLPELVIEERGGILCPVDDVEAFVSAVRRLAGDADLRDAMGAFNRTRVEAEFSLTVMARRYKVVYANLGAACKL
jgi:glycosyltransferase involved in cell wall biosynthesis